MFHSFLIRSNFDLHACRAEGLSWTLTVAALGLFAHDGAHPALHHIGDTMFSNDRFGGLQRFGFGGEPLLALLAFIERVDLINRALGALAQALFLKPGVGQRTHDQTPLLPSPRLTRLILADLAQ